MSEDNKAASPAARSGSHVSDILAMDQLTVAHLQKALTVSHLANALQSSGSGSGEQAQTAGNNQTSGQSHQNSK